MIITLHTQVIKHCKGPSSFAFIKFGSVDAAVEIMSRLKAIAPSYRINWAKRNTSLHIRNCKLNAARLMPIT